MQKVKLQKSVPLFFNFSQLPHSSTVKFLIREVLNEPLEPLTKEQARELRSMYKGRKRVFLAEKDKDLIDFFFKTPLSIQYAVFKKLNEKLKGGANHEAI